MTRSTVVLLTAVVLLTLAGGVAVAGGGGGGGDCDAYGTGTELRLLDFCFDAFAHHVEAGATITVRNDGDAPHTITASDGSFDSGTLSSGETFAVTFDEPGVVPVYCAPHGTPGGGGMAGVIVVGEPAPEAASASELAGELTRTLGLEAERVQGMLDEQADALGAEVSALSREIAELRTAVDEEGVADPDATVLGATDPIRGTSATTAGLLGLALGIAASALLVGRRAVGAGRPPSGADPDGGGA